MSATALPMRSAPGAGRWTGGMFAPAPDAGAASRYYKPLGRYTSAFALAADMAMLTLGGALKRQEMVSARFGDILSELLSAVDRAQALAGRGAPGRPTCRCSHGAWRRASPPSRRASTKSSPISRTVRWRGCCAFIMLPLGAAPCRGPSDRLTQACASHSARAVRHARPADGRHLPRRGPMTVRWRGSNAPSSSRSRPTTARAPAQGPRSRCRPRRAQQGLINEAEAAQLESCREGRSRRSSRSTTSRRRRFRPNAPSLKET